MNDTLSGMMWGCLITLWMVMIFCGSCDDIQTMDKIKKGVKYEGKIYHAVIDSARTDSLHNWRNK